jgi:hypothetical protein
MIVFGAAYFGASSKTVAGFMERNVGAVKLILAAVFFIVGALLLWAVPVSADLSEVEEKLAEIRSLTDLPLGVGFGIKDPPTAAAIARVADAVVVGSALVGRMGELADDPERMRREVGELIAAMRQAMDQTPTD